MGAAEVCMARPLVSNKHAKRIESRHASQKVKPVTCPGSTEVQLGHQACHCHEEKRKFGVERPPAQGVVGR